MKNKIAAILILSLFSPAGAWAGCNCYFNWYCSGCSNIGARTTGREGPFGSPEACDSAAGAFKSDMDSMGGGLDFSPSCDCDCDDSGVSSAGTGGYATQQGSGVSDQTSAQWQVQEQERLRQEAAVHAKKYIEDQERRRAQEEARQREWEKKKEEALSMMKGATPTEMGLKSTAGGEEVELRPKGTEFFGIPLKGSPDEPGIKTQKLGSAGQLPSFSEFENLRRAFWLYQKAARVASPEEAAFLSQQADEAAQGHPLQVEVPPAEKTSQITKEQLIKIQDYTDRVRTGKRELDEIFKGRTELTAKRAELNQQLSSLEKQLQSLEQNTSPGTPLTTPQVSGGEGEPQSKPQEEVKPEKEMTVEVSKPEEGKKQQDDLLAQLLEVQKNLQQLDAQATDLLSRQKNTEAEIQANEEQLKKIMKSQ